VKAVLDNRQWAHGPKNFLKNGKILPNPEQPRRIEVLQTAASAAGCEFEAPADFGIGPIAAIHSVDYLIFLETIHARWREIAGASDEVIPNIHPDCRAGSYPQSPVGQAGFHQADTACPIAEGTWQAAYWSAQTALSAANMVINGETTAYALCRPPGHHAFSNLAGGFCFLNNSAIAAQHFLQAGLRPVILDVDVHHGNGTQSIYYNRDDVLTISLHADPLQFYPFYWGHAQERGEGRGLGYNLNLPLPKGADEVLFLNTLETSFRHIESFGANVIIVALGLDAHEADPFQGFKISKPGFAKIATLIAGLKLPTLLVQEGGYLQPALGDNLASYLHGANS
jgi:acetoin utilization deacetylase AcuC-like enzyme